MFTNEDPCSLEKQWSTKARTQVGNKLYDAGTSQKQEMSKPTVMPSLLDLCVTLPSTQLQLYMRELLHVKVQLAWHSTVEVSSNISA